VTCANVAKSSVLKIRYDITSTSIVFCGIMLGRFLAFDDGSRHRNATGSPESDRPARIFAVVFAGTVLKTWDRDLATPLNQEAFWLMA
jgi:hypothetical protein